MRFQHAVLTTVLLAVPSAMQSQQTVKHIQTDQAAIATGVWAGDTFYLSGHTITNP